MWDSTPINGRDWGTSESCDDVIINTLRRLFTSNIKQAGFNDLSEETLSPEANGASLLSQVFEANQDNNEESSPSSSSPDSIGMDLSDPPQELLPVTIAEDPLIGQGLAGASRDFRRRQTSFAKHRRISLFASAINPAEKFFRNRKSLFVRTNQTFACCQRSLLPESSPEFYSMKDSVVTKISPNSSPQETNLSPLNDADILQLVFDFLDERELTMVASLVSTKWFEAATHSHANLMLLSVGCGSERRNDDEYFEKMESATPSNDTTAAALMERSWNYLASTYPWACFLSEGAFKRVYKVFNHQHRVEEAVSVM
jgi:hypothetical protein